MAGTVLRRWNGNSGGRRRGPVSRLLVLCHLERLLVLLLVELRKRLLVSRLICEMWMLRSLVVLRLRRRLILTVRSVYTFHVVQLHSLAVRLLCLLDLLAL